jgi:hypothetical protein
VAALTTAVLKSDAPKAPELREVNLAGGDSMRSYKVADASEPGGVRTRVAGVILPSRRQPTPDEVQRINETLSGLEQRLDARAATTTATAEPAAAAATPAG